MNNKNIEKNWSEIKTKIKTKWNKFSDTDIDSFKDDLSKISQKVQKVYGTAKEQADMQFEEFKKSIQSMIGNENEKVNSHKDQATPISGNVKQPSTAADPMSKAI